MPKHLARLVFALGLTQTVTSAHACGFEDPNSVMIQRGVLNMVYPNALHVVGALTQARMNGILSSEADPLAKDLFAFNKTARLLQRFGERLQGLPGAEEDFAISMVLIESMLWTRFSIHRGNVDTSVHVSGAQRGDVVIVTGEAALRQIVDHRLTFRQAEDLGLVRLYGAGAEIARFRRISNGIGGF